MEAQPRVGTPLPSLPLSTILVKSLQTRARAIYLSPCALVLLSLQEIQQHLEQSGVFPVGLHHIAGASYQLPQGPQGHLNAQKATSHVN